MSIKYRLYSELEIDSLCDLMMQLGYEHCEESLSKNVAEIRKRGGEVFVAELDGKVIGCAGAIIDVRLAEGSSGEIVSVVVDSDYRGKGIGAGLIRQSEHWLKSKVTKIRIRSNALRAEAPEFYGSLGYSLQKSQSVFRKDV